MPDFTHWVVRDRRREAYLQGVIGSEVFYRLHDDQCVVLLQQEIEAAKRVMYREGSHYGDLQVDVARWPFHLFTWSMPWDPVWSALSRTETPDGA